MPFDRTQHQSSEEKRRARELSLESSHPPAQIPGYKLQQFIGSGAYGEVWSATDLKTGRRVAVKFYTRSSAGVQQLMREVEKLLAVTSDARYVVQLFDVGWDADPPYYVMDYIENGSLEDRLKDGNGMPVAEAVELFTEVATGMMNLHAKGILHCDLKPGNVLLDQDDNPRVADFGQSRLKTDQTPALGTLFYMAPEQADMDAVPDASWDVYGLGALLFSMLTGKPPYYNNELARKIESTEAIDDRLETYRETLSSAVRPSEHRQIPGVDRMLADLIDRCIDPDPNKRFRNIQSILLALQQRQVVQTRRPLMLLGLLLPLLLMGVVSLFGWWAFKEARDKTDQAVIVKAHESNRFAATLAAQSASSRIEEYFRVVRQLAKDEDFHDDFQAFIADDELLKLRVAISDPNKNYDQNAEFDAARDLFQSNPIRTRLQTYIQERLDNKDGDYPIAASWFISDRFGNQVASVFTDSFDPATHEVVETENVTLGRNYAYRSYFTGPHLVDGVKMYDDLAPEEKALLSGQSIEDLYRRTIIEKPNLSMAFQSKQTNTWKVAFSAPIFSKNDEVIGIVAVTIDLGSLTKFPYEKQQLHYTMLVDGRQGQLTGTILEHPLYERIRNLGIELDEELFEVNHVNLDEVVDQDLGFSNELFRDPVGETEAGKRLEYGSEAIVSIREVMVESNDPKNSGLYVLAVQDNDEIMSDVRELGTVLGYLAALAGLCLAALAVAMWWFVNRMMRESRERLARAFLPGESTDFQEMETIPAGVVGGTTRYVPDNDG